MSNWPIRDTIPMNSLYYSCIQQQAATNFLNYHHHHHQKTSPFSTKTPNHQQSYSYPTLPLSVRQQILDYFVRERIETNVNLICELINGGINYFDLWMLCEINNYNDTDVEMILNQLTLNSHNLIELIIGGPEWIYNPQLVNGPLMNLFKDGNLTKLESLKLQQVNDDRMLYRILSNCTNLLKLEIKEPSITDHHINKIINRLIEFKKSTNQLFKLKQLTLPSSVRNSGLFSCLSIFNDLISLSVSNFEPILDYLDEIDIDSSLSSSPSSSFSIQQQQQLKQQQQQLKQQLKQLNKLTITKPMGKDAVEQIVKYCPNLSELNLEVQEIMHLTAICKLRSLKSLSLHNSPNLPLNFLNDVLPILECIGRQFVSLSLEQFDILDLVEISKLCPILHSFSAQWFTLLSVGRQSATFRLFNHHDSSLQQSSSSSSSLIKNNKSSSKDQSFSKLRLLRLRPNQNHNLSSLAIEFLIRNAKSLQYLELYCCSQFDNSLFEHWFQLTDGFKELKYLIVRHCNDLNRTIIGRLLNKSQLMYLELDRPVQKNKDDPIDLNIVL